MRKLKLNNYKKVFQKTKIIEFEIHSKKKKIEIPQVVKFLIGQNEKFHKSEKLAHIDLQLRLNHLDIARKVKPSWPRPKVEPSLCGLNIDLSQPGMKSRRVFPDQRSS